MTQITSFSISSEYGRSVFALSIPYSSTGLAIAVALFISYTCSTFRSESVPLSNASQTTPSRTSQPTTSRSRDKVSRCFLIFTAFINNALLACVGIVVVGSFHVLSAANTAIDALQMMQSFIAIHVITPAKVLYHYADASFLVDDTNVQHDAWNTIGASLGALRENRPHFIRLKETAMDTHANLEDFAKLFDSAARMVVLTVLTLALLVTFGLFLIFMSDVFVTKERRIRFISFSFLLVPVCAVWIYTALCTSVAVATGKACASLQ